jgi:uncharacterized membrane protein
MRALVTGLVVLGLAGSAACRSLSRIHTKAAVQEAIEKHLKQQPDIVFQNMTVEVGAVTFNGDAAEAQVKIRSKQAPNLAVGMLYKLRRAGNAWEVESSSAASMAGTSPHGNTATPTPSPSTNPADLAPQPSH